MEDFATLALVVGLVIVASASIDVLKQAFNALTHSRKASKLVVRVDGNDYVIDVSKIDTTDSRDIDQAIIAVQGSVGRSQAKKNKGAHVAAA